MDRIKYLLLRFLREEATPAEQAELEAWAEEAPANQELILDLQDPAKVAEALATLDSLHRTEAWEQVATYAATHRPASILPLDPEESYRRPNRRLKWIRWTAAAAVLIAVSTITILNRTKQEQTPAVAASTPTHDVLPGGNKAVLTLSGGRQVILDSTTQDTVLTEGAAVIAGAKGKLAYNAGTDASAPVSFNTLTTPRGGQYQLTLPDGTQVWLNASSSITYPTAFRDDERVVNITGEAYFEVAHDPGHGFRVVTPTTAVQDIGTSFNINSYSDETSVVTTVLTGKVRFIPAPANFSQHTPTLASHTVMLLLAGEQAAMDPKGELKGVDHPDLARALAWKNGLFAFSDADLPTVMRQLSRWYNVDVKYEGEIPKDKYQFNGKIGKTLTLDQVLKILTKTQVHYSIEGTQLTIRP